MKTFRIFARIIKGIAYLTIDLILQLVPAHRRPLPWRPRQYYPERLRWSSYPALRAFVSWHINNAVVIEIGDTPPLCFATARRTIKNTLGEVSHPDKIIRRGDTVRLVYADSNRRLSILKMGQLCIGIDQEVEEEDRALVDFRTTPYTRPIVMGEDPVMRAVVEQAWMSGTPTGATYDPETGLSYRNLGDPPAAAQVFDREALEELIRMHKEIHERD